jgi:hypothetical protein
MNSSTLHSQQWHADDLLQRLLATGLTILVALTLLMLFSYQSGRLAKNNIHNEVVTFMTLHLIPKKMSMLKKQIPDDIVQRTFDKKTVKKIKKYAIPSTETTIITMPDADKSATADLKKLPSAPLQIDSKSIRRAYNDSKSDIEKMAERSGKSLNDSRANKYDRFGAAFAQAEKPDCIGKQTAGAGLLAIPLIAYMVVADKCK